MTAIRSAAFSPPPVSAGAAAAYQALFLSIRRAAIGRRLTMRLGREDLSMTVTEIVSLLDPRGLLSTRLGVRFTVGDIRWGDKTFGQANVVIRNIWLRMGSWPALEATGVELTLDVPSHAVDNLLRAARPSLSGVIDGDGVARLRWARRPTWANVEVDVEVDEATEAVRVRLTPRVISIGRRRWKLPAGTPGRRLALTNLPPGLRLKAVRLESCHLRVDAVLPHWQMPVPRGGRTARKAQ